MIAEACTRIGLPKPREVIVTQASAHIGVPPSLHFPRSQRKDGSERRHIRAVLVFDEPVCTPVLNGATGALARGLLEEPETEADPAAIA